MSTRGAIARVTGDGFQGVYHHWDSYPSGLGATLFHLYNGHFDRDLEKMLKVLIDDHPAGWSTINGKNFDYSAGYQERDQAICGTCGKPNWEHYYQNWEHHGKPLTSKANKEMAQCNYVALGHSFDLVPTNNPECYCHGGRHEDAMVVTEKDAADIGCEWVYAFNHKAQMIVLGSYNDDGKKMIGMFGMGNPDAKWRIRATVDLNGPEPHWGQIK